MTAIAAREGLAVNDAAMRELASQANQDLRLVLGQLQMLRRRAAAVRYDDVKAGAAGAAKDTAMSPFDAARRLLEPGAPMTLGDQVCTRGGGVGWKAGVCVCVLCLWHAARPLDAQQQTTHNINNKRPYQTTQSPNHPINQIKPYNQNIKDRARLPGRRPRAAAHRRELRQPGAGHLRPRRRQAGARAFWISWDSLGHEIQTQSTNFCAGLAVFMCVHACAGLATFAGTARTLAHSGLVTRNTQTNTRTNVCRQQRLRVLAKAADCISAADGVNRRVRGSGQWGLLPFAALLGAITPAVYTRGRREAFSEYDTVRGGRARSKESGGGVIVVLLWAVLGGVSGGCLVGLAAQPCFLLRSFFSNQQQQNNDHQKQHNKQTVVPLPRVARRQQHRRQAEAPARGAGHQPRGERPRARGARRRAHALCARAARAAHAADRGARRGRRRRRRRGHAGAPGAVRAVRAVGAAFCRCAWRVGSRGRLLWAAQTTSKAIPPPHRRHHLHTHTQYNIMLHCTPPHNRSTASRASSGTSSST